MAELTVTQGLEEDREWLYDLYRRTMRPCIDATWGWDEEYQYSEFNSNLAPETFKIVSSMERRVGAYCVKEKEDHLWLEMILIEPCYQGTGIGRSIMQKIQSIAGSRGMPLQLSVIKANPVVPFYQKLGFLQYDEDEAFYKLQWRG